MSKKPDPQKVYRRLLTLAAKHYGLNITFTDTSDTIEKEKEKDHDNDERQKTA